MGYRQKWRSYGQKRNVERNGELRTEAEMPETVVKDGNVDGVDGAENRMGRT